MAFTPSPQQQSYFDWVSTGSGSAFLEAVAGAGKTTTLIEGLTRMNGSIAFAAYNKKIADEIREKVAKRGLSNQVKVGTFHSFGFNAWRRAYPQVKAGPEAADNKADMTKVEVTTNFAEGSDPTRLYALKLWPLVAKLISLAKQRGLGLFGAIDDESRWYDIVDHFALEEEIEDPSSLPDAIEMAIDGLHFHIRIAHEIIDFDDMIYMPLVKGVKIWENDWLLVDEAQDTNPARRALARKMLRRNGRAVFVGDRHQAIYGFTGADNDAVDLIVREFGCKLLPLTVTYRCPQQVVLEARKVVSHIEAHPSAPMGSVGQLDEFDNLFNQSLTRTDAILCRNTRPLVQAAFALLRRDVPCHVEGRDIGASLIKLANRYEASSLGELRDKVSTYCETETEKLIAKGRETQAEALQDRVGTLFVIMDNCRSVDDLRSKIVSMFRDTNGKDAETLTLSTVHKSKGREWDRVFILGRDELMPSPYARKDWQKDQEFNLVYVAVTRSKDRLVYVPLMPKED